jgi:hypothetical protein
MSKLIKGKKFEDKLKNVSDRKEEGRKSDSLRFCPRSEKKQQTTTISDQLSIEVVIVIKCRK